MRDWSINNEQLASIVEHQWPLEGQRRSRYQNVVPLVAGQSILGGKAVGFCAGRYANFWRFRRFN